MELEKQIESDPYGDYMAAAVAASDAASEVLMSRFHADVRNLASWEKSPGALVTETDIESDRAITETLKASGCGGVIISEESNVNLSEPNKGDDDDRKIE